MRSHVGNSYKVGDQCGPFGEGIWFACDVWISNAEMTMISVGEEEVSEGKDFPGGNGDFSGNGGSGEEAENVFLEMNCGGMELNL